MASIKKRPGSKFYVACYTLPDGTRKQVSTGVDDRFEAQKIANGFEQATELAMGGKLTRQRAFKLINEIARAAGNELFEDETLGNFLDRWIAGQKGAVKDSTYRIYKGLIHSFKEYLGDAISSPPLFLTVRQCMGFKRSMLERGLSPSTVNISLGTMTTAFEDARRQHLVEENPFKDVPRVRKVKPAEKKPFTLEQFKELVEKTDGEWSVLILLAGLTGQRQKDCSLLQWTQVAFEDNRIDFFRRKTDDTFAVPLHPTLKSTLEEWHSQLGKPKSGSVFPELSKRPPTGRKSLSDEFRNIILPKIGIVQKYGGKSGVGRKVSEYSFHSLRHSLSSWLNGLGISETDRMRIIGHEDKKVSRNYTHSQFSDALRVLTKLGV